MKTSSTDASVSLSNSDLPPRSVSFTEPDSLNFFIQFNLNFCPLLPSPNLILTIDSTATPLARADNLHFHEIHLVKDE